MSNKCFCHFNGYEVKDAAARRDIAGIQENMTELDGRVDQIANDQIPEEYLQASVDQFVENNESGLATKTELAELDSKLSSEIVDINGNLESINNLEGLKYNFDFSVKNQYSTPTENGGYHPNNNVNMSLHFDINNNTQKKLGIKIRIYDEVGFQISLLMFLLDSNGNVVGNQNGYNLGVAKEGIVGEKVFEPIPDIASLNVAYDKVSIRAIVATKGNTTDTSKCIYVTEAYYQDINELPFIVKDNNEKIELIEKSTKDFCADGVVDKYIKNVTFYTSYIDKHFMLGNIRRNYNGQTGCILFECDENGENPVGVATFVTDVIDHVVGNTKYGRIVFDIDMSSMEDGGRLANTGLGFKISQARYNSSVNLQGTQKYNEPIITIVDDDGGNNFPLLAEMLKEKGVTCTSALITDWVGSSPYMTLEQIMSLKNDGFDFISHTSNHSKDIFGASGGTGNAHNFALTTDEEIEDALKTSRNYLIKYGLNYEGIAWPWGHYPTEYHETLNNPDDTDEYVCGAENQMERYANIAKKLGYRYGLNSIGGIAENGVYNNMWINRVPFYSDEVNYPVSYYTNQIDTCVEKGAWLILMTHVNDSTYASIDKIESIVDYAQSKGVKILNLKEAMKIKKNSVSVGNYYNEYDSLYVGSDGSIK